MRRSSGDHRSSGLSKVLLVAMCLGCCHATLLVAQKAHGANSPKYDLRTETKIKGIVEDIKLPPKGSEKEIVHLLLKSDADTLDVYLCPKSFLDDMGMTFSKGDDISLTGSKIKQGDADLMLAREIVKGTDTFMLRDEKGNPVWN